MPPSQDTLSAVNRQITCVGTFPCIIKYCGRLVKETIYVCPDVEDFLVVWYVCQQVNILPDTYPKPTGCFTILSGFGKINQSINQSLFICCRIHIQYRKQ